MQTIFMKDAVIAAERRNNGSLQRRSNRNVAGALPLYRLDRKEKANPEARIPDEKGSDAIGSGDAAQKGIQTGYDIFQLL